MSNLRIMHLISLIIILAFSPSCKNQKLPADILIISLEKTPCYGPCPAYKMEIFSSGLVRFKGESNHKMIGNYESSLHQEDLQKIVQRFRDSNFFKFKNQYTGNVSDLPTTYIYFKDQSNEKTIQDYYNAPEQLKELEQVVENLIPTLPWKKTD